MRDNNVEALVEYKDVEYAATGYGYYSPARGPSYASGGEPEDAGIEDVAVWMMDEDDNEVDVTDLYNNDSEFAEVVDRALWDAFYGRLGG